MTGQMTREDALKRISSPEMSEDFLDKEFQYVANKLDITKKELIEIFNAKNKTYSNYKNKRFLIGIGANIMRMLGLEKGYLDDRNS